MAKLSGYPELLPAQRVVEQQVIEHLGRVFELHGFVNIETRAVEPVAELLRKGEIDKEVYGIRRLNDETESASAADNASELALHYDLTMPFARYVVDNANELAFPFRRYQIQKVWRGERPQQGRYREFTQADIDIVGRDSLPFTADIDIAQVMAEALAGLPIPSVTIGVNNRKLLEGFYLGIGASNPSAVMRTIDKLDKLPAETIREILRDEAGLTGGQAEQCLALSQLELVEADSLSEQVLALGVRHDLLDAGLVELQQVIEGVQTSDRVTITPDLRIARGLDYYTGTVFETRLDGYQQLGSICSGGRYDELARDNRSRYPGVGISLGVTRLLVPLLADGLRATRSVPTVVLVALTSEDTRAESTRVAAQLRSRGVNTEVAPKPQKFGQQIKYAERRGIPFVWFAGDVGHQVRDIRTGEQRAADPQSWAPPAADLRPGISR